MDRKHIMDLFLNNETPERVPVGFWHHFVSFHDHYGGDIPEIYDTVVREQKRYIDEVKPDFLKIMSDGFFGHPSVSEGLISTVSDIENIRSVGEDHPWIGKQIQYVKDICDYAGDGLYKYYSVFSPLQYIRLRFEEYDEDFKKFVRLFMEDRSAMVQAAGRIAEDIKILVGKLFTETGVDGIYYSVQCVQDERFTNEVHKELVEPLDRVILDEILKYTDNVILHICGYGHYTNELSRYADYPVKAFNWAVHTENISLGEGKKILGGKPVLGGFDNNGDSILYKSTDEELKQEVFRILQEAGTAGVGLGADCTISEDVDKERLEKIRAYAAEFMKA